MGLCCGLSPLSPAVPPQRWMEQETKSLGAGNSDLSSVGRNQGWKWTLKHLEVRTGTLQAALQEPVGTPQEWWLCGEEGEQALPAPLPGSCLHTYPGGMGQCQSQTPSR